MLLTVTSVAVICCVGAALGAAPVVPIAPTGFASPLNPYYAGRNPLPLGNNNPYYNTASATAPILSYTDNHNGVDGSYSFSFATGDGKQAQESGFLKDSYVDNTGAPQGTQVKEGSFAYTSPEGVPVQVTYVADENGFRHSGVHIPADGKGVSPLYNGINGQVFDTRLGAVNYPNRFGQFGQYNSLSPFNAGYPYNSGLNTYNPYRRPTAIDQIKKTQA